MYLNLTNLNYHGNRSIILQQVPIIDMLNRSIKCFSGSDLEVLFKILLLHCFNTNDPQNWMVESRILRHSNPGQKALMRNSILANFWS